MTLINAIKTIVDKKDTAKIKIGATDGSSFFFVGTVGEFIEESDKINRVVLTYDKETLENAKETLRRTKGFGRSYTAFESKEKARVAKLKEKSPKKYKKLKPDLSDENFDRYLKRVDARIKNLEATIKRKEGVLSGPLMCDREISEHFVADSVVDEDTIVIIVCGDENGRYWSFDERGENMPALSLNLDVANEAA